MQVEADETEPLRPSRLGATVVGLPDREVANNLLAPLARAGSMVTRGVGCAKPVQNSFLALRRRCVPRVSALKENECRHFIN